MEEDMKHKKTKMTYVDKVLQGKTLPKEARILEEKRKSPKRGK